MPYYLEKSWGRSFRHFPEGMNLNMINGDWRMPRYYEFFKKNAKDKVILDVGAGLGLIGLKALEYGAQHVYLVEMNPETASALKKLVRLHPQSHKITVIEHDFHSVNRSFFSTDPDYMVCELWGPHLWNEGIHATHSKAKELFPQIEIVPGIYKSYFNIVEVPQSDRVMWPEEWLAGVKLADVYKEHYEGYLLDRSGVENKNLTAPVECFSLVDERLISHFETVVDDDYRNVFLRLHHEIVWPGDDVMGYRDTYLYVPELATGQKISVHLDDLYLPIFTVQ